MKVKRERRKTEKPKINESHKLIDKEQQKETSESKSRIEASIDQIWEAGIVDQPSLEPNEKLQLNKRSQKDSSSKISVRDMNEADDKSDGEEMDTNRGLIQAKESELKERVITDGEIVNIESERVDYAPVFRPGDRSVNINRPNRTSNEAKR